MGAHQPADVNSADDTDDGKVFLHFTMSLDGFIADTAGMVTTWA
jgi:hypothetical protein